MSLSFELGLPLHELRRMPLADLHQYQTYAARHGLPSSRRELLLAQVALVVAQVQGVEGLRVADFMAILQPPADENPTDETDPEQAAEQVAAALGFKPRRRKPEQPETQN